MRKNLFFALLFSWSTLFSFSFDFGSLFNDAIENISEPTTTNNSILATSSLSDETISDGLKEALSVGVKYAVSELGKKDGYLNNVDVKIPLPKDLAKAESIVRGFGGDKYVDEFIKSMNTAATDAAPKTVDIFLDAIKAITLQDVNKILAGDEDAATEYFRTHTTSSLIKTVRPIVQKTMQQNDVSYYYDKANSFYKSDIKSRAVEFGIASFLPKESDEKLDEYITRKAIDGLFKRIAVKEAEVRENPLAQTTDLLRNVFGL